jgi:hypothetical protein
MYYSYNHKKIKPDEKKFIPHFGCSNTFLRQL